MTVFTVTRPARPLAEDMFADLGYPHVDFTPLTDGGQQVTVDADLTPDQIVRARCRLASADADRETLLWTAYGAWKANKTYLALAAPTQAQAVAQVDALTAQINGVLELLLPELSGAPSTDTPTFG